LIALRYKQVAQASRLGQRRLKPAATKNISLIAIGYEICGQKFISGLAAVGLISLTANC
jgi:hypothetical protein